MDDDPEFNGLILGRIIITRVLSGNDVVDHVIAVTSDEDEIPLAEALGMLRLAEDTLIRSRMSKP